MDPGDHGEKIGDGLRLCRNVGWDAHGDEGIGQIDRISGLKCDAVESRATAPDGGETLVGDRIVDRPSQQPVVDRQRNRHAVGGESVDVVTGAIERIDHPP